MMKKLTVRLEDYIYDRLNLVSNENGISVNKIVSNILEKYINQPKEINYMKELDRDLKILNSNLEKVSKRQYKHFLVSQQHFANVGYLSNADIKEDKCLKEILRREILRGNGHGNEMRFLSLF